MRLVWLDSRRREEIRLFSNFAADGWREFSLQTFQLKTARSLNLSASASLSLSPFCVIDAKIYLFLLLIIETD